MSLNKKPQEPPAETPHKKLSIGKMLQGFLMSYGVFSILMTLYLNWTGSFYFSGPDAFRKNEYHPFRSEEAREKYLDYYTAKEKEWPIASEEKMVQTSYGQTFVRISGPEDAPPLVLIPGGGGTSLMWKEYIMPLSMNYRTFALDFIYGFGRSVYTKKMDCTECITKWLDELFTALELNDSINLAGYSYGAWISSQYLLAYPERLHKVILLSPAYTVYHGNREYERRAFRSLIPLRYFMKKQLCRSCEDMVKTKKGRALADELIDGMRLSIRCFKTKTPAAMTVLTDDELKGITKPVLYVAGENEKSYSVHEAVKRLNKLARDMRIEIIPDRGHCLMFTDPELVSGKILDFLYHE